MINDLSKLDRRHDKKLLDELQKMFLAGRPESSMVWCVIEHTDKGKRELHFVVVIFDLFFGKQVHPYIDRIDRRGFAAWVESFALRHGLEIPMDKLRLRPPFEHLHLNTCQIQFLHEVWERVHGWAQTGVLTCRNDLKSRLHSAGYQVRCHSYNGKPLQQPEIIGPEGCKLRLKNSIYYRCDFGELIKNGVPYEILHSKNREASKIEEATQPADVEKSIPTIPTVSSSDHETADAEAFLPPPSGEIADIEDPAQVASPTHAPTSGGRVRKRRRINQEIDFPPL